MFKQYQEVELVEDMMSDELLGKPVKLHRGQRGVIVEIHRAPGLPAGYDVEFSNEHGETVAVIIVTEEKIKPLRQKHLPSSNQEVA